MSASLLVILFQKLWMCVSAHDSSH